MFQQHSKVKDRKSNKAIKEEEPESVLQKHSKTIEDQESNKASKR